MNQILAFPLGRGLFRRLSVRTGRLELFLSRKLTCDRRAHVPRDAADLVEELGAPPAVLEYAVHSTSLHDTLAGANEELVTTPAYSQKYSLFRA